ncbi:MAG: type VI secretion system-associated protein VasI [Pseudomonadota bacterium]
MKRITLSSLLLLSPLSLPAVTLDPIDVATCQAETMPLARLTCYDTLLQTPVHAVDIPAPVAPREPTLLDHIRTQESQRHTDDEPLLLNSQIEHADSGQQQVLITTPAIGAIGTRPILALSCQRNITQLQIVLDEPLRGKTVNLQILDASDNLRSEALWHIRGTGQIVASGRGMPSIHHIRQLQHTPYIQLHSNIAALDGLRFDLTHFAARLRQLAHACHWHPGLIGTRHKIPEHRP